MRPNPAIAFALAAFLSACMQPEDNRRAGVDEFPNSVYAQVNGFLADTKQSQNIATVPGLNDSLLKQQVFNVAAAAKTAALKSSAQPIGGAEPNGLAWDSQAVNRGLHTLAKVGATSALALATAADSACSGTLTWDTTAVLPGKKIVNSLTVCVDAKLIDSIHGNETIIHGHVVATFDNGRVETTDLGDADGDGILNPVKGKASKARMEVTVLDKGVLETTVLVVGPGPDNNFDTQADNLIYSASWSKTSGKDTLGYAAYSDADSDGVLIDNAKPSLIDLELYQKGPTADHSDAVWSRANLRLLTQPGTDAKQARRVKFSLETADGRKTTAQVMSSRDSVDFRMQDTVHAVFLTQGTAASDSLDSMRVELTMNLGKDFDDKTDDSVFAMDIRIANKSGEPRASHFNFQSDKPLASGKDPQAGKISLESVFADGTAQTVDGSLTAVALDVTFTDRNGKRLHVVWDRQGKGISLVNLN